MYEQNTVASAAEPRQSSFAELEKTTEFLEREAIELGSQLDAVLNNLRPDTMSGDLKKELEVPCANRFEELQRRIQKLQGIIAWCRRDASELYELTAKRRSP